MKWCKHWRAKSFFESRPLEVASLFQNPSKRLSILQAGCSLEWSNDFLKTNQLSGLFGWRIKLLQTVTHVLEEGNLFLCPYYCSFCCLTNTDIYLNSKQLCLIDFKCVQLSKHSLHTSTDSPLSCKEDRQSPNNF